jgi:hypothetical protein
MEKNETLKKDQIHIQENMSRCEEKFNEDMVLIKQIRENSKLTLDDERKKTADMVGIINATGDEGLKEEMGKLMSPPEDPPSE